MVERVAGPHGCARIQARVDRLVHGNPGAHRVLKAGVCELKLDFGPGFRVYYLRRGEDWLILLAGGDKSTQAADIRRALQLAADFTGGTS